VTNFRNIDIAVGECGCRAPPRTSGDESFTDEFEALT